MVEEGVPAKKSMAIPTEKDLESVKKRITELEEAFNLHEKNHETMINECIMKMY